ncbi:SapB/AmfS family lanthipeptide [Streptomyces sp. NPDC020379]
MVLLDLQAMNLVAREDMALHPGAMDSGLSVLSCDGDDDE